MTEDHQHQQPTPQHNSQSPKERKSIHDIRNQDFVSRLLAATPPYLYSTPVGTNNFFFSDMLRSLVQARNNETARNIQMQQQQAIARRPRKRTWSQHRPYYDNLSRERKDAEEKITVEKPLELTNKQMFPIATKYAKGELTNKDFCKIPIPSMCENKIIAPPTEFNQTLSSVSDTSNPVSDTLSTSIQPTDLVLPPPPPVFYPSLYPPYGIDPLHFFIDLRVSGHIFDRKKDNPSPLANADNNNITTSENEPLGKQRTGSAFTVPLPRNETKTSTAINLSSSSNEIEKIENYTKYYDLGDTKENHPSPKSNANYVLQNLPRLYSQFAAKDLIDSNSCYDNDTKSELDCDDLLQNGTDSSTGHIDVEILDSNKFRSDVRGGRSRSPTPDDQNIVHEID